MGPYRVLFQNFFHKSKIIHRTAKNVSHVIDLLLFQCLYYIVLCFIMDSCFNIKFSDENYPSRHSETRKVTVFEV